ncbi:DUF1648 domain-containing protein [Saccharopolyspora hirsuta]|uniref:DUF1648 domain-containing protein n=1 Tax=Saccharopolyspora hirsuta TaxID=1837 RepID=A0A5M7BS66_SACHI|nr:DUF1648 domain-containing protein [Saccharopolyspora hirsuta]KAA5832619.1 DUF1648 domain-containing protein [Saccharopolyspora hirsuta]
MTYRTRFLAASGLWAVAVTAVLLAGALAVRDRVPDPVASHWGFSGAPDGSMPFTGLLAVELITWLVIALVAVATAVRGAQRRAGRATTAAVLGAGAVFVVGMSALTTWANLDAADWRQASPLPVWQVLPVLAGAALGGWLGWWAGNRGPDARPEGDDGEVAELVLKPGQRAVWVSSVRSRTMLVIGGAAVLSSVVPLLAQAWVAAVVSALAGVVVFALSSARVQVDERGVHTSFGPLRWPVRRIRLEQIDRARVETRRALEVGGWGYRVLPNSTAIMLRGGECLALRLTSGRDFYISVDHPERGAELVNALITERSAL